MKIVTVVGARPQFIKLAPVSRELRNEFQEVLINTGQHYDYNMAGLFFSQLGIPKPDYDLEIGSSSHGEQTGSMMMKIEQILLEEKPDGVLVYGDTNSTIAGALTAAKLHIPVFHIEAGLRSYNRRMPEEINRVLTDHISSLLFVPGEAARNNLTAEGITNQVHLVGDVMYDAFLYNVGLANKHCNLSHFHLEKNNYYLATIHRAENTDDPERLRAIFHSLNQLQFKVVLPLHPRTRKKIEHFGIQVEGKVSIIEPVSYLEMIFLESNAKAIVTDSGGVQKEAYFAKVPCFTLREETEWNETVESNWNTLVDPFNDHLDQLITNYIEQPYVQNLYGDGKASAQIVQIIQRYLQK